MRLLHRLRWPLRDPAIREARDDYRDAQAAIRQALERQIVELQQQVTELQHENGRLQATAATAVMLSGLSQSFYAGASLRPKAGPENDPTVQAPAPGYRGPVGRHQRTEIRTEVHPRAVLRRDITK